MKNISFGCQSSYTIPSFVEISSFAGGFTSSKEGCSPLKITFKNLSSISPTTKFEWDFGDGEKSSDVNPIHSYTSAGSYTVTMNMQLADSSCKVPTVIKPDYVVVPKSGTINFSGDRLSNCSVPLTVNFKDLSNEGVSYSWDFGDGSQSTEKNPQHIYTKEGNFSVSLKVVEASGCEKVLRKDAYIKIGNPQAIFIIANGSGCIPLNTIFQDATNSADPIVSRLWDFGDGTSLVDAAPTHFYTREGKYNVSLSITTSSGCKSVSASQIVMAGTKVKAAFNIDQFPRTGCKPLSHTFKNLSNPGYDSLWLQPELTEKAGGINGSHTMKPGDKEYTHSYNSIPGMYSPHILSFRNGCVDTFFYKNAIKILPPKAYIRYTVPACNAGAVIFKDSSIGAHRVSWNFGTGKSGDTSNLRNPSFNYTKPGTYKVYLTAYYDEEPYHCKDIDSLSIYIPEYGLSKINFSTDKASGCIPMTSMLMPEVNYPDPNTTVVAWKWNLGNGIISNEKSPKISYKNPGIYDITLVVQNSRGCIDSIRKPAMIKASGPKAEFTDSKPGCFPYDLKVRDKSTSIFKVKSRIWTLDNKDISAGNDTLLVHQFNSKKPSLQEQRDGIKLQLKITDELGCTDTISKRIKVTSPLLSYDKKIGSSCEGDTLALNTRMSDTSGIGPFKFEWKFNDSIFVGKKVEKFLPSGNNKMIFKATDSYGCEDSIRITSSVRLDAPKTNFQAAPTLITCWPGQVIFKDSSKVGKTGIKEYLWSFGDGSSSILKDPSHIYTRPGEYDIKLVIKDSIGCTDTIIKEKYIAIRGPLGTFTVDTAYGYSPFPVKLTGTALNAEKYLWDFGDGVLGSEKEVNHIYEKPGIYIPKMIVEDELGCKSVYEKDTIVIVACSPVNQYVDTIICYGSTIKLQAGYPNALHEWVGLNSSAPSIETSKTGVYICEIKMPGMPCLAFDTFKIVVIDLRFELGNDTTVCYGNTVSLDSKLPSKYQFRWSTGTTSSSYIVDKTNSYKLTVQDSTNICTSKDSINIKVLSLPLANAGPDMDICKGEKASLNGSGGSVFRWEPSKTSSASLTVNPNKNTTYKLVVTDSLKCSESTDEVMVVVHELPVSSLPQDTIHCFEDGTFTIKAGKSQHYEWTPGKTRSENFEITHEGLYHVRLYNEGRCFVEDDINVLGICAPRVFVPTAFTPNGDGVNDKLEIFGA
ncbi:MAG TPA: PKD domain-containing protein, partial [Cytophagaceae bacterium]